jgi:hypothetical protein
VKSYEKIEKVFEINFPNTAELNFRFSSNVDNKVFYFYFHWFNLQWQGWAKIDILPIRYIGMYPLVPSWWAFMDYSIFIKFSGEKIGILDLPDCKIEVIKWRR